MNRIKACECAPSEHSTNAHLPSFFSLTSFASAPHPPHPLSATALSAILSHCFLISFDHCQLIRGQHLGGRHGNRQNQIFSALKGGLRFAGGGRAMTNIPGIDSRDGAEQNRSRDDCRCVSARMWVCMRYLISPESTAHPVDPVQWERVEWRVVCESVYMCGRRSGGTYRELQAAITLATVYKYFHIDNSFFSGCREEVVLAAYRPPIFPASPSLYLRTCQYTS